MENKRIFITGMGAVTPVGIGVGPGRGSAAGAIVAYAMDITTFDPLENGLMFGFLSWVILKALTGKAKDVKPMMWISSALFLIYAVKIVFIPGI